MGFRLDEVGLGFKGLFGLEFRGLVGLGFRGLIGLRLIKVKVQGFNWVGVYWV